MNFENQSTFGEVMGNIIVAGFLLTQCVHVCKNELIKVVLCVFG